MNPATLLQTKDCTHDESQLIIIPKFSVANLFPGKKFSPQIFIAGLNAKECLRCGKILIDEDKSTLSELKSLAPTLQKLYHGKEITVDFKSTHKALVIQDQPIFQNDGPLAEAASFKSVAPKYDLNEVVLEEETKRKLDQIKARIEFGEIFYIKYDFQRVRQYGKATVVLFYGPSGTGKTRTAQGLSKTLNMNFLDINLADLESRFMSQTSKNIRSAFESAKEQQALIFFDEADTVLGKRLTSVTQGVDAEINMSRSTMLKELESFEGICVFATNFESNIDAAFVRRITYKIPFFLPSEDNCKALWNYFLLETLPLEEDKSLWIPELAIASDGLSGADLVSAIEMSFPMAIAENKEAPVITKAFLLLAIEEIKKGKSAIGDSIEVQEIKKMYNLK